MQKILFATTATMSAVTQGLTILEDQAQPVIMELTEVEDGQTRDDDAATAVETYSYDEGSQECTRTTVYQAFHLGDFEHPSKITHTDTLPR